MNINKQPDSEMEAKKALNEEIKRIGLEVTADNKKITGYYGKASDINIPEGITEIGNGAFKNKKFTSISSRCRLFPHSLRLHSSLRFIFERDY